MNHGFVLLLVGRLLVGLSLLLLVPAVLSWWLGEPEAVAFLLSVPLPAAAGLALVLRYRRGENRRLGRRATFLLIATAWIAACLAGAQPYLLIKGPGFWIDGLFESVSGFTTTGATVLFLPEAECRGLLLWRALSQWLGGLGTLALALVVLPRLAVGGMELLGSGAPHGLQQQLASHLASSAPTLAGVYAGFTVVGAGALWVAGMQPFDAACHAMSALSTGGFSTRSGNVGTWDSLAVELVMVLLMLAGAVSFALHARALRGRPVSVLRHPEVRAFLGIWLGVSALQMLNAVARGFPVADVARAARQGVFQATSFVTTSGFHTADYDTWPAFARTLLFLMLFVGGCAGSTSGSIKVVRVMIVFKKVAADLVRLVRPHAVVPVHLGRQGVADEVVDSITVFFHMFLIAFAISGLVLAMTGLDLITAFGASAACLANFGPGFGLAGPGDSYAALPSAAKLWLSVVMLAGRVELYPLLLLVLFGVRRGRSV